MKDNLRKVLICTSNGRVVERANLRVNRKSFHPGVKFQAMRNKASLTLVNLRFIKMEDDGTIHAAKVK